MENMKKSKENKIEKFQMSQKDLEKWENSLEGVIYNLSVIGETIHKDEKCKILIARTLLKLPKEVRDKVLDEVLFIYTNACGTVRNLFFPVPNGCKGIEKPIIILNFHEMKGGIEMDTIAHEIAHFILGHHKLGVNNHSKEREADDLTVKWDFNRAYKEKDYKRFERLKNDYVEEEIDNKIVELIKELPDICL